MNLIKHKQTLILIAPNGEVVEEYPLITSVVYYKASWFERHLRWQVQEDAAFLRPLVNQALSSITPEIVKTLQFYENLLEGLKHPKTREEKDSYNSSQKDIFSRFHQGPLHNEK